VGGVSGACQARDDDVTDSPPSHFCMKTCMYVFIQNAHYFCLILTETGMSQQILAELPNIKFYENLFMHSKVVTCRQTDILKVIGTPLQLLVANMPKLQQHFSVLHKLLFRFGFRTPETHLMTDPGRNNGKYLISLCLNVWLNVLLHG
jgi:hypothetical protein